MSNRSSGLGSSGLPSGWTDEDGSLQRAHHTNIRSGLSPVLNDSWTTKSSSPEDEEEQKSKQTQSKTKPNQMKTAANVSHSTATDSSNKSSNRTSAPVSSNQPSSGSVRNVNANNS